MPLFVFALLFRVVIEGIRTWVRKARARKPTSLCAGCSNAHVQYGANAKLAIACAYGGALRPMRLDVLYCTDYRARNQPARMNVIGFVRDITPANERLVAAQFPGD